MKSREIVKRAIEFRSPPRIPFYLSGSPDYPDDVMEIREMDRARAGWFFDTPGYDDWGCLWRQTEIDNMGQVVKHPLADWSALGSFRPPDARDPFYFERLEPLVSEAGERYLVVCCHFNLIERLHMLRGFVRAMEDFYLNPDKVETVLDMILDFKVAHLDELHRRFGDRVDGIFLTDDWGTQQNTYVGTEIHDRFFADRYRALFDAVHSHGWHVIFHSCGKINAFVPRWIEAGADVLNILQPRCYGLVEFGEQFKGKVCFLTSVDIQMTLSRGTLEEIREEAELLVKHWSTPDGGLIVLDWAKLDDKTTPPESAHAASREFARLATYWRDRQALPAQSGELGMSRDK